MTCCDSWYKSVQWSERTGLYIEPPLKSTPISQQKLEYIITLPERVHCHPPSSATVLPPCLAHFVSVGTIVPQKKYPLEDYFDVGDGRRARLLIFLCIDTCKPTI